MNGYPVVTIISFFLGGFVFASFVEYWAHRMMHRWRWAGKVHREHHARNEGQGVLREYWDYVKPSVLLMVPMFLVSWPAGVGWLLGTNVFGLFSAYAHQLQHENPLRCFWMPMPTHYVHHKFNMWHFNFGLAVDWWDRVFRTYKPIPRDQWREGIAPPRRRKSMLKVRWW